MTETTRAFQEYDWTGWTDWTQLDGGIASVSVQDVNGTDYVYELRNTGQF